MSNIPELPRELHPAWECCDRHWYGCMQPERPFDSWETWDPDCPKCILRMRLVLAQEGDTIVIQANTEDERAFDGMSLPEALAVLTDA